mgnify:FL=1
MTPVEGIIVLYILMLTGLIGCMIFSKVPVALHTPLTSGSNLIKAIALVGALGAGAAAAIGALELIKIANAHAHIDFVNRIVEADHQVPLNAMILMVLGGLFGSVAFSGSLIAFAKLQGWMAGVIRFGGQRALNVLAFLATFILGGLMLYQTEMIPGTTTIIAGNFPIEFLLGFFILSLVFGVMLTVPIESTDMPVVISLFNALTGLAVGFGGFVLGNIAMLIAGVVVCSAGLVVTLLIAKAMSRSLGNVLLRSNR